MLTRIGAHAIVYGLGHAGGRLLLLLALPVVTTYLAPEEFGVVAIVMLIGAALRSVFGLGLGVSTGIVHFESDMPERRAAAIWSAAAVSWASAGAMLASGALAAPIIATLVFGESRLAGLIVLQILAAACMLAAEPLQLRLQFDGRAARFVASTLGGGVIGVACGILLVAAGGYGVGGWIFGAALGAAATLVFSVVWGAPWPFRRPDAAAVARLLALGWPLIPSALLLFVAVNLAPYFVARLAGLAEAGIFAVGFQLGMGMTLATAAFTSAWYPMFQSYATRAAEGSALFPRVAKAYLLAFGFATLLFFVLADPVVAVLADGEYAAGARVVGPIAASQYLLGFWSVLLPGMYFAGETRWVPLLQGATAAIAAGGHVVLVPRLGAEGAAYAVLAGALTLTLLQLALNRARRYAVDDCRAGDALATLALLAGCIAADRLSAATLAGGSRAASAMALLAVFATFGWVTLESDEKQAVRRKIADLSGRFSRGAT